ncbi:hypothetical protein ES695_12430 [Candidatus Atribacteria bacterium 1244-E10-H5-B2]|nr:MAG: hypothetical protein ES695_12430 [Candidatus Atribacteria bacterium 1244-E10-H5-B2]
MGESKVSKKTIFLGIMRRYLKMHIKVKCKNCDWKGQAIVGKKGYPLDNYKCPKCGRNIERAKGRYNYHSESAQLK